MVHYDGCGHAGVVLLVGGRDVLVVVLRWISVLGSTPCYCYGFLSKFPQTDPIVRFGVNELELGNWTMEWLRLDWISESSVCLQSLKNN